MRINFSIKIVNRYLRSIFFAQSICYRFSYDFSYIGLHGILFIIISYLIVNDVEDNFSHFSK